VLRKLHNCIERNGEWEAVAKEAFELAKKRKYYGEQEKKLLAILRTMSEQKNSAGGEFMFISITRQGSVNYTLIPQLKGLDLEVYRKDEVVSWKLTKI